MRKRVVSSALVTLLALGPACGGQDSSPTAESAAQTESELRNLQPNEVIGQLTYGQTSAKVAYHAPPKYRAFTFSGNAGDKVDAWVGSEDGDAVAYLLAPNFKTLKTNDDDSSTTRDSHVQATLTASGTHYVAFREKELDDASFTVSLAKAGATPSPVPPPPSPTMVSDFPGGPPPAGAPTSLDIVRDQTLDGEIVVNGPLVIHSGAHVTSPTGNLLVRARSILVEASASISITPVSNSAAGAGDKGASYPSPSGFPWTLAGGGGGYGSPGQSGGSGSYNECPDQFFALSGRISANGGGAGAPAEANTGAGGSGRIKVLSSTLSPTVSGSLIGVVEISLLPPTWITSATHPDQTATYQDGTSDVDVRWSRPFASVSGYYVAVNGDADAVATQTTDKFQTSEKILVPRASLSANGTTYVHVASVDASGQVSLGEARFAITLSDAVPTITSATHPDRSQWPNRTDVQFAWILPLADSAYAKVHYVVDHYGSTIPSKADAALPITQKQLFLPNQPSGIWVLHLLAEDKFGNLTSNAAHYVFNTGANPGIASILGTVTTAPKKPIANANITVNRGLFSLVTDATGTYNFQTLPAGTWEVSASSSAGAPVTRTVTVAAGGFQRADFSL